MTAAVPVRPPASVACTVSAKLGVVSKSSAAALATVIAPVVGSIAKAPPVLPAGDREGARVAGVGSLAATVPTTVPFALFSGSAKVWSLTTGASLTLRQVHRHRRGVGEAAGVGRLHGQREARRRLEVERRGVRDRDRAGRRSRSRRRRPCCPPVIA